jgi:DNA-binding transcriptional LysR family regulator
MNASAPLESLPAVLAAARLGSLSAAALELGVTHGAISRRIHAVERWLGARLFDRHGRGVSLTAAGELFARTAERSVSAITAIAEDIRAANATGKLRLSVLPSVARLWLMPRLLDLQGNPPDLSIRLLTEHRVASLDKREADLAIRVGTGVWPGLDATLLLPEFLVPVATHQIASTVSDIDSVLEQRLLHDSDGRDWRLWCRAMGIRYRPQGGEHRFDDYDLTLAAAEAGLGVALARLPLADGFLGSSRLIEVGAPAIASDRAHYVVVRAGEARTDVLRLRARLIEAAGATSFDTKRFNAVDAASGH